MRPLILALLLLAAPVAAQEIATPRPHALVEEAVIRLGDLFEGAGPRAAAPVGAAPLPGRRLVVEAAQLQALARAHGLPWRPLTAQDRVVVERPGRAIPREEILAAIRAELVRHGLDPEAELEPGPLAPVVVPPAAAAQVGVEAASLEAGRFGAVLVVVAEGMPVLRQRVTGRALPTVPVVLATRRIAVGEVIRPADIRPGRMRADRARPGLAETPEQVLGLAARRAVPAEGGFAPGDLAPPPLVEKNALVTMLVEAPGLSLSAQGRALDAAPRGALVLVMNLASRMVVEAQVVGPGRVRVAMGATPLREVP